MAQLFSFCRSMSIDIYANWDQSWTNKVKYRTSATRSFFGWWFTSWITPAASLRLIFLPMAILPCPRPSSKSSGFQGLSLHRHHWVSLCPTTSAPGCFKDGFTPLANSYSKRHVRRNIFQLLVVSSGILSEIKTLLIYIHIYIYIYIYIFVRLYSYAITHKPDWSAVGTNTCIYTSTDIIDDGNNATS